MNQALKHAADLMHREMMALMEKGSLPQGGCELTEGDAAKVAEFGNMSIELKRLASQAHATPKVSPQDREAMLSALQRINFTKLEEEVSLRIGAMQAIAQGGYGADQQQRDMLGINLVWPLLCKLTDFIGLIDIEETQEAPAGAECFDLNMDRHATDTPVSGRFIIRPSRKDGDGEVSRIA